MRNSNSSAMESAIRILTRRDHTSKELTLKLRNKGFGRAAVSDALARCRELGYLNDVKTAAIMTEHLIAKGYGVLRIRHVLTQKGIGDTLIEKTLAICGDEERQVSRARHQLKRKSASLNRETDPWKRRQKAYRYLAGRGFPSAVIRQVIEDI